MTSSIPVPGSEIPFATVAQVTLPVQHELGLAVAMVLTFAGMVLHWQLPRQRMSMEERIKDGKLTPLQARRRLQIINWCAPIVTSAGILLLIGAMLTMAE